MVFFFLSKYILDIHLHRRRIHLVLRHTVHPVQHIKAQHHTVLQVQDIRLSHRHRTHHQVRNTVRRHQRTVLQVRHIHLRRRLTLLYLHGEQAVPILLHRHSILQDHMLTVHPVRRYVF